MAARLQESRDKAGVVTVWRTQTETDVGQRGPEAETGLLHADLLRADRILVTDLSP